MFALSTLIIRFSISTTLKSSWANYINRLHTRLQYCHPNSDGWTALTVFIKFFDIARLNPIRVAAGLQWTPVMAVRLNWREQSCSSALPCKLTVLGKKACSLVIPVSWSIILPRLVTAQAFRNYKIYHILSETNELSFCEKGFSIHSFYTGMVSSPADISKKVFERGGIPKVMEFLPGCLRAL